MSKKNNCRVCGLYTEDEPWGLDGLTPSYQICECCGVEFGNEDYTLESIKTYRERWIKEGHKWFNNKDEPREWDIEAQLKNIPKKYR